MGKKTDLRRGGPAAGRRLPLNPGSGMDDAVEQILFDRGVPAEQGTRPESDKEGLRDASKDTEER